MASTTEYRTIVCEQPRVSVAPGAIITMMALAADGQHVAGVDLDSGALLRAWSSEPATVRIRPYDVVRFSVSDDFDAVPDPAQPEAVGTDGPVEVVDRLRGRPAERLLRPLLHPERQPLLGVSATAIPFWERCSDHPSVAVVEPADRVTLLRQGSYLACRFVWQNHERELPCLDRAMAGHMDRGMRTMMTASKGARLVVALTAPIEGRCHKVVEAVLLRP